jgi:hypothetical protein
VSRTRGFAPAAGAGRDPALLFAGRAASASIRLGEDRTRARFRDQVRSGPIRGSRPLSSLRRDPTDRAGGRRGAGGGPGSGRASRECRRGGGGTAHACVVRPCGRPGPADGEKRRAASFRAREAAGPTANGNARARLPSRTSARRKRGDRRRAASELSRPGSRQRRASAADGGPVRGGSAVSGAERTPSRPSRPALLVPPEPIMMRPARARRSRPKVRGRVGRGGSDVRASAPLLVASPFQLLRPGPRSRCREARRAVRGKRSERDRPASQRPSSSSSEPPGLRVVDGTVVGPSEARRGADGHGLFPTTLKKLGGGSMAPGTASDSLSSHPARIVGRSPPASLWIRARSLRRRCRCPQEQGRGGPLRTRLSPRRPAAAPSSFGETIFAAAGLPRGNRGEGTPAPPRPAPRRARFPRGDEGAAAAAAAATTRCSRRPRRLRRGRQGPPPARPKRSALPARERAPSGAFLAPPRRGRREGRAAPPCRVI